MADDETYDAACIRAELLGIAPPNKEEFEKARQERLEQEAQERDVAEAALLESQDESMNHIGGRLDELNTILSSTQKKINRFKDSARGSITNMFNRGSVDIPDSGGASGSRRNTNASTGEANDEENQNNENTTESNEDVGEIKPIIPTEKIRQAKQDIAKKMSSHLDKLDLLVNKAENAEISMTEQTKQMRKMAK